MLAALSLTAPAEIYTTILRRTNCYPCLIITQRHRGERKVCGQCQRSSDLATASPVMSRPKVGGSGTLCPGKCRPGCWAPVIAANNDSLREVVPNLDWVASHTRTCIRRHQMDLARDAVLAQCSVSRSDQTLDSSHVHITVLSPSSTNIGVLVSSQKREKMK